MQEVYQYYQNSRISGNKRGQFEKGLPEECLRLKGILSQSISLEEKLILMRRIYTVEDSQKWMNYLKTELLQMAE